jgi:hypothetical protein
VATKATWRGRHPDDVGFEHVSGVPARDLEDSEYDALSDDQKAAVLAHPELYSVRGARAERATVEQRDEPVTAAGKEG